jgi:hypothetical protein
MGGLGIWRAFLLDSSCFPSSQDVYGSFESLAVSDTNKHSWLNSIYLNACLLSTRLETRAEELIGEERE